MKDYILFWQLLNNIEDLGLLGHEEIKLCHEKIPFGGI